MLTPHLSLKAPCPRGPPLANCPPRSGQQVAPGLHRPDPERPAGLRRPKSPRKGARFPDAAAPLGHRSKARTARNSYRRCGPGPPHAPPARPGSPRAGDPSVWVRHRLGPSRPRAGHRAWGLLSSPPKRERTRVGSNLAWSFPASPLPGAASRGVARRAGRWRGGERVDRRPGPVLKGGHGGDDRLRKGPATGARGYDDPQRRRPPDPRTCPPAGENAVRGRGRCAERG